MIEQKLLDTLTIDELIMAFEEVCLAQDTELRNARLHKKPELVHQLFAIGKELKSRGREARLALTSLYDHPNMHVRLKAARYTLVVAPLPSRQILEKIANFGHMPQAAEARETLRHIDEGTFRD
ncbi:MAG: DUF2019 domain-containing protein [Methylovirgula sp.]|nr:DUF2019 domain-containing protein [Methylovirgula sp.]